MIFEVKEFREVIEVKAKCFDWQGNGFNFLVHEVGDNFFNFYKFL